MSNRHSDAQRLQMINGQLRASDVNDLDLLAAFSAVPREAFVAPGHAAVAYSDTDPPSTGPKGRRLLSPRTLGLLLKVARPKKGERALTVGGGAGYAAAVLAALGCETTALETDLTAARAAPLKGVTLAEGPLDAPPAQGGPFDVIVVCGAFEVAPDKLLGALKEGGRLAGVSAITGAKRVVLFENIGGALSRRDSYDAAADVLPGLARPAAFAF